MCRTLLALAFAIGIMPLAAAAQSVDANNGRGFEAEKVYNFFGLDSVNPFNGNLNVSLPIGQAYELRPGFSYQFVLTYNSKVWDYEVDDATKNRTAIPETYSNSGFGWLLSLGKVQKPQNSRGYLYISPDGAQHDMKFPAPDGVSYSEDSSYLRMTITPAGAQPAQVTGIRIERPDGVVMTFDAAGDLVEMRDRFDNWVKSSINGLVWTVTDGHGEAGAVRTHSITFENASPVYYTANFMKRIKTVSLAVFPKASNAQAVYTFTYEDTTVENGGCGTPSNGHFEQPAQYRVPLLKKVDLPQGSYTMAYRTANADANGNVACSSGIIEELFLPTKGSIAWTHGAYSLPRPYCVFDALDPDRGIWTDTYSGVTQRRLERHDGTVQEQTVYDAVIQPAGTGNFTCGKNNYVGRELPPKVAVTSVRGAGTTVEQYFSALRPTGWYTSETNGPKVIEYGLPFTRTEPSVGTSPNTLYLSTRTYEGATHLRSTYAAYEYEGTGGAPGHNTRMVRSRTVYHDDTGDTVLDPVTQVDTKERRCKDSNVVKPCWTQTSRSDYAGFGYYRIEQSTSNFPGAVTRTVETKYNPDPNAPWSVAATRWLWGDYTTTKFTEGTASRQTTTTFDLDRGVITSVLRGAAGGLLSVTCRDARGYVTSERWLGGNGLDVPATPCSHTRRAGEFVLNHTFDFNSSPHTIGHRAVWEGNTALGLTDQTSIAEAVVDETLDVNTRLPVTTRDGAGLTTTYMFDAMNRLTSLQPPGMAATTYMYTDATSTTPATVAMSTGSATSGSIRKTYQYDPFGRLWREKSLMPDASWSVRETLYDSQGRRAAVSELMKLVVPAGSTEFDFVPHRKTTFTDYDAFGRAQTVTTPDGRVATVAYRGVRTTSREMSIAGVTRPVRTIEETDAQGRLVSVTEDAAGVPVKTLYGYDPSGNLTEVRMAGLQVRRFVYDERGLMTSETHPESGTTMYADFNARGQARRRLVGTVRDLTFVYDDGGRLTDLKRTSDEALIKQYRYDAGTGRLVATARYNDLPDLGTVAVGESIGYDSAGRRARRDQTVGNGAGFSGRSFAHTQGFNDLGLRSWIGYPFDTRQSSGGWTLTYGYVNGALTTVDGWASLTYQPNGTIATVAHNGAVTETWSEDPHGMPRPAMIEVKRGADTLWSSGAYTYDGGGNIASIGAMKYWYDPHGRLTSWGYEFPGSYTRRTISYDVFGNQLALLVSGCSQTAAGRIQCYTSSTLARQVAGTSNQYQDSTYDRAGNVIADYGRTFTYDEVNMPTSVIADGRTFLYVYNVDDERIAAVERFGDGTTKTTWTLRGFGNELLSVWKDQAWTEDEIWRGSSLAGYRTAAGKRHYSLDHLGSPRVITSDTGSPLGTQNFEPFGSGGSTGSGALQFTGHERDRANLGDGTVELPDYAHARLLDTGGGRFLSVDPGRDWELRRPQSWNMYAYVRNNPLSNTDPTGRQVACANEPQVCTAEATLKPPKNAANWTPEQRAAENAKNAQRAQLAEEGRLVASRGTARPSSAAVAAANGGAAPAGQHLDHTTEIVLGGAPLSKENIAPLDATVNTSNGARVKNAIAGLADGTKVTRFNYTVLSGGSVLTALIQARSYGTFMENQEKAHPGKVNMNDMARWVFTGETKATHPPCSPGNPC